MGLLWAGAPFVCPALTLPLVGLAVVAEAPAAWADAYSSGGYSRPGGTFSSGATRRPSTGGGSYSRPYGGGTSGLSGGDRSMSRSYSGEAFRSYQQQQQAPEVRRPPTYGGTQYPSAPRRAPLQSYGGAPYAGAPSRFGAWDMLFLMSLLNSLNAPGHTQFFRDNRDNPDYQAWRREADRIAQQDPAVAARLADLDSRLAGTPPLAAAEPSRRPSTGSAGFSTIILVIVVGGIVLVVLAYLRRRPPPSPPGAPAALSGSARSRFRVGMTFPFDPSPFLLLSGTTKVTSPASGGMASIEAVGLVTDGSVALHRLYFPGRDHFLQLHLAAAGEPDECRAFNRIDEVTPASREEWGFWLDPAQGMIGWPQFQTKDGRLYDRVWAPGAGRIVPRSQSETIQDPQGTQQRKLQSMLYGAPSGAAPPAPETEYILVSAVEDGKQAWVEIHAGIDVNPATLSLPSVPLSA